MTVVHAVPLIRRVQALVQAAGSYRKAAQVVGVNYATLFRLGRGRTQPSDKVLARLGMVRVVTYKRV